MPKLYVSYDCGASYQDALENADLARLEAAGRRYDEQGLRWYIEDDDGEWVAYSKIHRQTIDFLKSLSQPDEPVDPTSEPLNPPRVRR